MFFIGRTDGRSSQNYSSEPHKIYIKIYKKVYLEQGMNLSRQARIHACTQLPRQSRVKAPRQAMIAADSRTLPQMVSNVWLSSAILLVQRLCSPPRPLWIFSARSRRRLVASIFCWSLSCAICLAHSSLYSDSSFSVTMASSSSFFLRSLFMISSLD